MPAWADDCVVSTTPSIDGRAVRSYLGLVMGETILGTNFLRDFKASFTDTFGGRSGSYESQMRRARETAIQEMVGEAVGLGANGVLGVQVQYHAIGKDNDMLMVAVAGTAVLLEGGAADASGHAPGAAASPLDRMGAIAKLPPEDPVACFFCGRPMSMTDAKVVSVVLGGIPLSPLLCERHARALAQGERPAVRTRRVHDEDLAWFRDPDYRPSWDFDPSSIGPTIPWAALGDPVSLLAPLPRFIVHADDPRWMAAGGPSE